MYGLFAHAQLVEQLIDRNARIAPDKVQQPVMHPVPAALGEESIGGGGEGTIGVKQQFLGFAENTFGGHEGLGNCYG
ncbi:hypothetical protein HNQ50_000945 [Silvimonas terrae]|uniref:Uncharacterized protein n=1 Tax=Silvimonas terrae TaxID=300266 RepID=A0A840RCW7_9NEIS|nr:hypothetical protein [Silvimonas terrae]MBB5190223.1 hypothetical protein [Silvimonas terrae]